MQRRQVFLATVAFTICFSVWALIGPLAPEIRAEYGLSEFGTAVLIAVPVLLGSVLRVPIGIVADRYGGRLAFSSLLAFAVIPAAGIALTRSYWVLLFWAFLLGVSGASISAGVTFVSGWVPRGRQGAALGILGIGNIGTAIAVFSAPRLSDLLGWQWVFCVFGVLSAVWAAVFWVCARDADRRQPPTLAHIAHVFIHRRLVRVLSAFYILTLGGFVALSGYLPTLLTREFHLSLADAGLRTAGFAIVCATARPIGGQLSDRVGGPRILQIVFVALVPLVLLLASTSLWAFTAGALGAAVMMGLGNGAVFKLVAQYFSAEVGAVAGVVAAVGGLGGFVLPITLGIVHENTGGYGPAFVLMALFAAAMLALAVSVFGWRTARGGPSDSRRGANTKVARSIG